MGSDAVFVQGTFPSFKDVGSAPLSPVGRRRSKSPPLLYSFRTFYTAAAASSRARFCKPFVFARGSVSTKIFTGELW